MKKMVLRFVCLVIPQRCDNDKGDDMKPMIYNSLDKDAPQLSPTKGALNTVLKACLVTGYGEKQGAGWQIVWQDVLADKIAIRSTNLTSLGAVLLLTDDKEGYANVNAYTAWESESGIGEFDKGYFVKYWERQTNPNWVVVATDKFFYIFIQSEIRSNTMRVMSGFGDAKSLRSDMSFAVCLCQKNYSYSHNYVGFTTIETQLGVANFPRVMYEKYVGYTQWGDRGVDDNHHTKTAVFSEFVMYMNIENLKKQPVFQLYGMLMPHAPPSVEKTENNIDMITHQLPYKNPILGFYQPWFGRVWLHTDDWGV